MALIDIKNLNFKYAGNEEKTLRDVSLTVNQGEFVVLCGASGCGKTTLLNLLKPSLAPNGSREGEILFLDKELKEHDERSIASDIGFVMQNPDSQIVTDKVWHELVFGLENMGIPTNIMKRRVGEMASFFGIQHLFRKKTSELSGGQKQLVNLASVLVMQPKLLVLDEPTSQLDPIAATEFIQTLHKLNTELGITIVIVEHRLEDVFPLADKVIIMNDGEIIMDDSPRVVGETIQDYPKAISMIHGLPSAVRIFSGLNQQGTCPLTVREGKDFLNKFYLPNEESSTEKSEMDSESVEKESAIIKLKDVCFKYERDLPDVLYKLNLTLRKGEVFSVLGGNGVGKSTLLSVLSGQRRAYKGKVIIRDKSIKKYKNNELYKHNLAFLPQNPQTVFLKSTVEEDYREISKVIGYPNEEMTELIKETLEKLGISHLADKHPYDLSGGEQQKAALGKILLLKPSIILLDEPTKGMDAFSKKGFSKILSDMKKEDITVLMVTHDVEFAAENSDRCGLFFDRNIISIDKTVEFFASNTFYTTASNRIARDFYPKAITVENVVEEAKTKERMKAHD
ncbi:ABC transporter ATP-binding protein [Vagococcus carniphilus]|uniref:ABC transporter ATP-binding protein n=1 Tax=Vagococcus carniphilus TaxID=218144 RepID=UPI003B5D0504